MTTWRASAACRNVDDVAIFFPSRGNTPDAVKAATFCGICPVAASCYADAEQFGRTDGTVMGGKFWTYGKPKPIPIRAPQGPSRSQLAQQRRTEAFQRFLEYREQGLTRRNAVGLVAAQYQVTLHAAYHWIRCGIADTARANAAKATAGA